MTAPSPYIVVLAKLGATLMRGSTEEVSDQVESRRSLGMKKCCSTAGVDAAEELFDAPGNDGIGGGRSPGESGGDRTVTPGIYAIWITLDDLVRTVEATERVDWRSAGCNVDWYIFSAESHACIACLRGRMQNQYSRNVMTAMATTPPTTPPTMGPIGVGGFSASWPGSDPIFTHFVDAHASQDCETN